MSSTRSIFLSLALLAFTALLTPCAHAGLIEIKNHQLWIDDQPQPQLFGAEVQYFRLRGGPGPNVPREKVIEIWNRALDNFVDAHLNAISFAIPWDFHEYAPGKFDFTGTVDEDHDGNPDYPSRDLKTWFELVEAHGINVVMVKPGPSIGADWGFLGTGAVPLWFHRKHPDAHARNASGQRIPMYSQLDANYLSAVRLWYKALYRQVLKDHIGPEKSLQFIQLDHQTGARADSIFGADYGPAAVKVYQSYLKEIYKTIAKVNAAHHTSWKTFGAIKAPVQAGLNNAEDQDWYRFQEVSQHAYLARLRKMWEDIGVKEPKVLFTSAETSRVSDNGLLPSPLALSDKGKTALPGVDLYPKTAEIPGQAETLFNEPFQVDHDVKAAETGGDRYYGQHQEWLIGPEVQGGWTTSAVVSPEARRQTYLSAMGHGLKAMFVYYFNEGDNWQYDWAAKAAEPFYKSLKADKRYKDIPADQLPGEFWSELNASFANKEIAAGWDLKQVLADGGLMPASLGFDAALDAEGNTREPFATLKEIGEKIIDPYGRQLAMSTEANDPVCLVKDPTAFAPSPIAGLNSTRINSSDASGLLGFLMQADVNPRILHWGVNARADFDACRLLVYQDNGFANAEFLKMLRERLDAGASVVTFLNDGVAKGLTTGAGTVCQALPNNFGQIQGSECQSGPGWLYHVPTSVYSDIGSGAYSTLSDMPERRMFLERVLDRAGVQPMFKVRGGSDRVTVFARKSLDQTRMWVTVKSGRANATPNRVLWKDGEPERTYSVSRIMEGLFFFYKGKDLATKGFMAGLGPYGSDVFIIEPADGF